MNNESQKLSIREKVGYGLGDTASNLFFQTTIYFLMYFYTDVFGITAKTAGTMFLVTRIWDAINDPMMGAIADRTKTRWGKFRPFLLWFAIPFGVIGVAMFTTPQMSDPGKIIYAYITYTLMMMVYTAINVPYCALMGVISPDPQERTIVSSFRFVLVFIAAFIVQYALTGMVIKFGGEKSSPQGWQTAMIILFSVAVVLFLITFFTTKERVQPIKEARNPFKQDLADLLRNGPWLLIGIATIFQLAYVVVRGGVIVYYFDYFIKDQPFELFGTTQLAIFGKVLDLSNVSSTGLGVAFMLSGTILTIIGAITTKWFCKFLDKPKVYALLFILAGVSTGLVYYIRPENLHILFGLQLITAFCMGPVSVLQWAIYTDTADYSEYKTGRRATALIMAASLFALKLGVAFGGAALGWILSGYGYAAGKELDAFAIKGICLAMSWYAAIPALIGGALMLFYPLSNKRMKMIEADLVERRKQYGIETNEME
ncbi:MAG: MFS transporter [Planctomycetota bacterium]|jgi:GPH family glycoside/pentoside/hexuronide:cation symporter